jgi:hypothetical protein
LSKIELEIGLGVPIFYHNLLCFAELDKYGNGPEELKFCSSRLSNDQLNRSP